MSTMTDAEFERLAVLYAMGSLDAGETARFEAERARRGAEGTRLERGVREAIERAGGGSRGVALSEREALAAVTAPPHGRGGWAWTLAVAVLAVAAAVAFAWGLGQRSRADGEAAAARFKAREADSLRTALSDAEAALGGRVPPGELAPLLAAPELVVVPLAGAGEAGGRLLAAEGGGALLVAEGLAPLGGDGAYQLWRRTGPVTERVAALGDAPRGFLFVLFGDAGFLAGAESLIVTAETGPAAALPSEPAVLEGRLPR